MMFVHFAPSHGSLEVFMSYEMAGTAGHDPSTPTRAPTYVVRQTTRATLGRSTAHSTLGSPGGASLAPLSLSLHARPDPRPLCCTRHYIGTRSVIGDVQHSHTPSKVDPFSLTTDAAGHLYSYSAPVFGFLNHYTFRTRPVFKLSRGCERRRATEQSGRLQVDAMPAAD